jgi:hypothetical protein
MTSPENFIVNSVILKTQKFDQDINITNVVSEIKIFENILMPYLTGSILMLDDAGILESAMVQGTEQIEISVQLPDQSDPIVKTFFITNVEHEVKKNDASAVVLLNIIENHGFMDKLTRISKAYTGTCEDIIARIAKDFLDKDIYRDDVTYKPSFQNSFRVVIPYMTALEAIEFIRDKATTELGAPYFIYSTMFSDNLVLADLETILQRTPWNRDQPFIYSAAFSSSVAREDLDTQSRIIYNYNTQSYEDTLKTIQEGAVGARLTVTDLSLSKTEQGHFSGLNSLNALRASGVVQAPQDLMPIDEQSTFNDLLLSDYDSKMYHFITSSTYNDALNYYEEDALQVSKYKNRVISQSIRKLLNKSPIEIIVPGRAFLKRNMLTTVGNCIELSIMKNVPSDQSTTGFLLDTRRTGDHIIFSKCHMFSVTSKSHRVSMGLSKLTNLRLEQ